MSSYACCAGLAVGRVINQVSFGGVELDESENLTQEVTVSGGKLKKGSGSEYEVSKAALRWHCTAFVEGFGLASCRRLPLDSKS